MINIGTVGNTWERGIAIAEALGKNYVGVIFAVGHNNVNDDFSIYIEGDIEYRKTSDDSYTVSEQDCLRIAEYRGFIRAIIVERGWLT